MEGSVYILPLSCQCYTQGCGFCALSLEPLAIQNRFQLEAKL